MDLPGIQQAFAAAGLTRVAKDLPALAQPSIRLTTAPADESVLAAGATKIGGLPDLPPDVSWPALNGVPMSFLAQVRLADAQPYDAGRALPPAGMLWFFYDAHQQTYGANPSDRGGWQVIFRQDAATAQLKRAAAPAGLPQGALFHACSVALSREMTLPQDPRSVLSSYDWTPDEQSRYENLLASFPSQADKAAPHNRLLGNPDAIQDDDMRLEAQLASHGVGGTSDPRAAALAPGAANWRLLFQLDSDENAGMRWGDQGLLFFWIERDALAAHRFDNVWLVLQSD